MATEIPTEALDAAATATEGHSVVPERAGWYCICGETGDDRNSRGGAYRHLLTLEIEAAAPFLIAEGRRQACGDGPHIYLSSACRHADDPGREGEDLHRRCQTDTLRYDGTHKIAAECKDCGAPCICPCHQEASGREFESGPVQVADRALASFLARYEQVEAVDG